MVSGVISVIQMNSMNDEIDNLTDVATLSVEAQGMVYHADYMIHMMHHYLEGNTEGTRDKFQNHSDTIYAGLINLEAAFPDFTTDIAGVKDILDEINLKVDATGTGVFDLLDDVTSISDDIHEEYPDIMSDLEAFELLEDPSNMIDLIEIKYHFERMIHLMHHYMDGTGMGDTGVTRPAFDTVFDDYSDHMDNLKANSTLSLDYTDLDDYISNVLVPSLLDSDTGMFDMLDSVEANSERVHVIFPSLILALENIAEQSIAKAQSDAGESVTTAIIVIVVIVAVVLLVGVIVTYVITKAISSPLKGLVESSDRVANDKDLTVKILEKGEKVRDDEVGLLEVSLNNMIENLTGIISSSQTSAEILTTTSEDIFSGSEEINASAEEVASTSQAMSDGASSQTELIAEVNQEIKDITGMVDDIIRKIQGNTDEVSQIALQTNILALNAGIEASRAGDYGRGFAVVAESVRKLSDQSKTASDQIALVAEEISTSLLSAFNKISESMFNIVSVSEETAASAEEVAAAAEEMTATIEELSSAAQELTSQAESSMVVIKQFKLPEE